MFDFIKQAAQLRSMQNQLAAEKIVGEKNGVSITMNAIFQVQEVKLNPELSIESQEKAVRDALNDAIQKIQRTVATRFGNQLK
jgi:DNA-binding protein YbaB